MNEYKLVYMNTDGIFEIYTACKNYRLAYMRFKRFCFKHNFRMLRIALTNAGVKFY